MGLGYIERVSSPLIFSVNLTHIQEPHSEIGLWNTNRELFLLFAEKVPADQKGLIINESAEQVHNRACCSFPDFIFSTNDNSIILSRMCAWVLCCSTYNFYHKVGKLGVVG